MGNHQTYRYGRGCVSYASGANGSLAIPQAEILYPTNIVDGALQINMRLPQQPPIPTRWYFTLIVDGYTSELFEIAVKPQSLN